MTAKPKILIIEDQPEVLRMMVLLLARAGCEALTAHDGNEGLQLARQPDIDLILLDIDLPDISGFEICRRLKEDPRVSRVPVIFVTGRFCEEDRRRGFALGAADYIDKPFDVSHFVRRILFHLETRHQGANRFSNEPPAAKFPESPRQ
jgi:DNA-binding response OmpR family regulator